MIVIDGPIECDSCGQQVQAAAYFPGYGVVCSMDLLKLVHEIDEKLLLTCDG